MHMTLEEQKCVVELARAFSIVWIEGESLGTWRNV